MTEIPEHLLKRAQAAREKAADQPSPTQPTPAYDADPRIPAHLHARSQNARAKAGHSDPFKAAEAEKAAKQQRLTVSKIALLHSVAPQRQALQSQPTDISGQIMHRRIFKPGSFAPYGVNDADFFVTLYGYKSKLVQVAEDRAVRLGQVQAWRMPIPKREFGKVLAQADLPPLRTANKLRRGAFNIEKGQVTPELAERVFSSAIAERVTNSVVVYEGTADQGSYGESYRKRIGAAVSVVRRPASLEEQAGSFSVDLVSLHGSKSVEEQSSDDGAVLDFERLIRVSPFSYERSTGGNDYAKAFTATSVVFGAFNDLLNDPSTGFQNAVYRTVDAGLR